MEAMLQSYPQGELASRQQDSILFQSSQACSSYLGPCRACQSEAHDSCNEAPVIHFLAHMLDKQDPWEYVLL
eukprot:5491068-Amphidinium_carterae.1